MNSRIAAWSALALFLSSSACSSGRLQPSTASANVAFEGKSAALFAQMAALPAGTREALFTSLGNLSFTDYYSLLEKHATNDTVAIDGQSYVGSKAALVGSRSAILALGKQFPTLSAWWKSSHTDPRAMSLADYQNMFRVLSSQAGSAAARAPELSLYMEKFAVKNPSSGGTCDDWNRMFSLLGINIPTLIAGYNGLNAVNDPYSYAKNIVAPHVGPKDGIAYASKSGPGGTPAVVFFPTRAGNPWRLDAAVWDQGQYYKGCTTSNPDGTADSPEPTQPAKWSQDNYHWELSDYDVEGTPAS